MNCNSTPAFIHFSRWNQKIRHHSETDENSHKLIVLTRYLAFRYLILVLRLNLLPLIYASRVIDPEYISNEQIVKK